MTLLLIYDALYNGKIQLTDEVVTSARAKSMGGSQVFLEEGEKQTVETLIKCKMCIRDRYISGLGEIIKHGLIKDAAYYEWLKVHKEAILARDTQTVIDMIAVSCHIKQEVVENDPEEAGERALLNFGHTLGHAVEKLMNFTMLHGECVAVGMHAAAWLSMEKGMLTEAAYKDITDTIASFGLPVSVKGLEPEQIVAVSKSDKKMDKGRVKFILLDPEGHAVIDRSIRDEQLLAAASVIVRNGEQS